jgi:nicotinate-nucleotide--dimethylbenzimidazole phosphoribosyltransferase
VKERAGNQTAPASGFGHRPPLLDLGMRLGEGSGVALAVSILRAAHACHNCMATFAEASVANKSH